MNLGRVLGFISENNIDPEDVFKLVERIQTMDMNDEATLRGVIRDASKIAGKKIDKKKEDDLVNKILKEGISENIFDLF